jgi:hypothetical protein
LILSDLRLKAAQLQANDFGVVFGIMMIEMELELTHYLSAMVAKLSELSGIRAKALDCDGPDFTDAEIGDYLMSFKRDISKARFAKISERHLKIESLKSDHQQFMVRTIIAILSVFL